MARIVRASDVFDVSAVHAGKRTGCLADFDWQCKGHPPVDTCILKLLSKSFVWIRSLKSKGSLPFFFDFKNGPEKNLTEGG